MARISILKSPDELTGKARRIAEKIVDTRKSLEGPFSVWMHAPEWAERVAHLGTLIRWEGTLEPRLRTLTALVGGVRITATRFPRYSSKNSRQAQVVLAGTCNCIVITGIGMTHHAGCRIIP